MNQIAKHAYFALVVSMTLTTAATVQSETAQSETHKSVNGSGDNVDLSVEAKSEHFRQEREALADDPFFGGGQLDSPSALTAVNQLAQIESRYAIATLCVGVGQGVAMLLEKPKTEVPPNLAL